MTYNLIIIIFEYIYVIKYSYPVQIILKQIYMIGRWDSNKYNQF